MKAETKLGIFTVLGLIVFGFSLIVYSYSFQLSTNFK